MYFQRASAGTIRLSWLFWQSQVNDVEGDQGAVVSRLCGGGQNSQPPQNSSSPPALPQRHTHTSLSASAYSPHSYGHGTIGGDSTAKKVEYTLQAEKQNN